jgi:enamine deaminase RidA (YjgF/YER057c/UK114 family)
MASRCFAVAVLAAVLGVGPAALAADAKDKPAAQAAGSIRYLPLDAPAGMSQAVIVEGLPLVHTRQILPLDAAGKLVGAGAADKQADQILANLEAVLAAAGSDLKKLVRVNVAAMTHEAADKFREQLSKRIGADVRPAISVVLSPTAQRLGLLAVDAVATGADKGPKVTLEQAKGLFGNKDCADAAVLPPGGVAYLSGRPDEGGLTASAVARSMAVLMKTLEQLKLSPAQVVSIKVFLKPVTSAQDVLGEVKKFFPGQLTPPVVFVEWIATVPVEIEIVAQLPLSGKPAQTVDFYNPPDVLPSAAFSRVALVRTPRQVYISGLSARDDEVDQGQDVFDQLKTILDQTGGDMQHLAKATYFVCDERVNRSLDKARSKFLDPLRPPAASKVTVHGVGRAERMLTVDMIAVGAKP